MSAGYLLLLPPSRAGHEVEAGTALALQCGLWRLGGCSVLTPAAQRQLWVCREPPQLDKHGPRGKTLLWQKPKSLRTSEGFFSFCRDQVDLVFGILEHLEVDVV